MPKITPYESQVVPEGGYNTAQANPNKIGNAEAFSDVGQGLQKLGAGIYDYADRHQSSQAALDLSGIHVDIQNELESMQTPLEGDSLEKFKAKYQDRINAASEKITNPRAREYFDKISATDQKSIYGMLAHKNATLIGAQQRENFVGTSKNLSTSVFNQPGVGNFNNSIAQLDEQATKLTGENVGLQKQLVREQGRGISFSNFKGNMIKAGGAYAKGLLDAGTYDRFLDGNDKATLTHEADVFDRSKKAQRDDSWQEKQRAQKDADDKISREFLKLDLDNMLSPDRIVLSEASPHVQEYFLNRIASKGYGGDKLYVATKKAALFDRIQLPEEDPKHIGSLDQLLEEAKGSYASKDEKDGKVKIMNQLPPRDLNDLSTYLQEKESNPAAWQLKQRAFKAGKNIIVRPTSFGRSDPIGDEKYNAFVSDFNATLKAKVDAGADPIDLTDPTSKDYLVPKIARKYTRTPQELIQEQVQMQRKTKAADVQSTLEQKQINATAPKFAGPNPVQQQVATSSAVQANPKARIPGESLQQWKKRVGAE